MIIGDFQALTEVLCQAGNARNMVIITSMQPGTAVSFMQLDPGRSWLSAKLERIARRNASTDAD
jgi:hypothetical protein